MLSSEFFRLTQYHLHSDDAYLPHASSGPLVPIL
jgi:hypothetical protein